MIRRALLLPGVVVLASFVTLGCSGDDSATRETVPPLTLPASVGDECHDATGDLTTDVKGGLPTATEPGSIDIVSASARPLGDKVHITFETKDPIDPSVRPVFLVGQGRPFDSLSFEARAEVDETGKWKISIINFRSSGSSVPVPVQPVVEGNHLSFDVPAAALPPLALYLSFGSTSVVDPYQGVLDDCSNIGTAPTLPG